MEKETRNGPVRGCGERLREFLNGRPDVGLSMEISLFTQCDGGSVELDLSAACIALLKRTRFLVILLLTNIVLNSLFRPLRSGSDCRTLRSCPSVNVLGIEPQTCHTGQRKRPQQPCVLELQLVSHSSDNSAVCDHYRYK